MSLVGIDVGSSSIKVTAYSEDGEMLAAASNNLTSIHHGAGLWEQDAEEVWQATSRGMRSLTETDSVRQDPPIAIAISASGRENFPADSGGNPLGHGIMGADIRGGEFESVPEGANIPEPWCLSCGHLRERMDPIFRLLWWRKNHPEIMEQAKFFLGWHDFLTLRICGRVATDKSSASRYAVYDLEKQDWSPERVAEYELEPDLLPDVLPWGSVIGTVRPEIAASWDLPAGTQLALGGHDVSCAAIGAGVSESGEACLISGSYENLMVMTSQLPTGRMLLRGLSVMPHPGEAGFAVLVVCPTGNAVLNWTRDLLKLSIAEVEEILQMRPLDPSPVLAVPYLSGAMAYWEGGRSLKGSLTGLTLATTPVDIVQAFMESIAYDHVNTLSFLMEERVRVSKIRATGGGTRSEWWTQLKADLIGNQIEVVEKQEAGTLGAAILAGVATGIYTDLDDVSKKVSGMRRIHIPDQARAKRHKENLEAYHNLVSTLL